MDTYKNDYLNLLIAMQLITEKNNVGEKTFEMLASKGLEKAFHLKKNEEEKENEIMEQ